MPISRPKITGIIRLRRFVPPQLEIEVKISKGELKDELSEVAAKLGLVEVEDDPLTIVNEEGICIMNKLLDQEVYYVSGGKIQEECASQQAYCGGKDQAPETSVLWAYDDRVLLHEPGGHRSPETPYRLKRAIEMLEKCRRSSLMLPWQIAPDPPSEGNIAKYCDPRFASIQEICAFHDIKKYRSFLENGSVIENLKSDVYCNEKTSSDAARISAGAVIDAGLKVLENVSKSRLGSILKEDFRTTPTTAYCLVRPPGHHCSCDTPSGFCLINNVAVGATWILRQPKKVLEKGGHPRSPRIAILDLDVHFGEGTAKFVDEYKHENESKFPLLYLSLHRYDNGSFYPFLPEGATTYTGQHHKGSLCNVAINTNAHIPSKCHEVISDTLLDKIMNQIFLPRLSKFQPDLVFVSLGFDAAYGDPLGKMAVEGGFARSVMQLKQWCSGETAMNNATPIGLVVVLEGGYNPEAVSTGILSVAHSLTFPPDDQEVQKFCSVSIPKVWSDLRKRKERHCHDEGEQAGAKHGDVADDSTLMKKHEEWCDKVVQKIQSLHCQAFP
eukprot:gene7863-5490_t